MTLRRVLLSTSVKGGVGKSIFSASVALSLARRGMKTALIDLDVTSAHAPDFIPPLEQPMKLLDNRTFQPGRVDGLEVFSMSLLVDPNKAVSLRGRDQYQVISDAFRNTNWQSEVAVLDMPPGAGDVFLGALRVFAHQIVGGILITQPAFPADTKRVLDLYRTHQVPILGLIENMAGFTCSKCSEVHQVFGPGDADALAKEFGVAAVWKVPLSMPIRRAVEARNPLLAPEVAAVADQVAERVLAASPEKVGLAARLAAKMRDVAATIIFDLMKTIVVSANRQLPLGAWQQEFGLNAAQTVGLIITNPAGDSLKFEEYFRLKDGRLQWFTQGRPKKRDVVIETDYQTLASCLLLDGGVSATDKFTNAYLSGQIRFYGDGAFPQALFIMRNVLSSEAVVHQVNERFGRALKMLAAGGE